MAGRLKNEVGGKYALEKLPKLIDIISAIPVTHRKALLPHLKVRPIRSASGVRTGRRAVGAGAGADRRWAGLRRSPSWRSCASRTAARTLP